jgi:hypothetical protein
VIADALDAFDTEANAFLWLVSPNPLLQGKLPLRAMSTGHTRRLRSLLATIKGGGVAYGRAKTTIIGRYFSGKKHTEMKRFLLVHRIAITSVSLHG